MGTVKKKSSNVKQLRTKRTLIPYPVPLHPLYHWIEAATFYHFRTNICLYICK